MRRKKVIALLISLTLLVSIAIPGTLAVSNDQEAASDSVTLTSGEQENNASAEETKPAESLKPSETETETNKTCTCGAAEGEAHKEGCPLYTAPEVPAEPEKTCTCGSTDGTHQEGCPLYTAPEAPAEPEKTCTCGSTDGTHQEGCPLYTAPEAPAEPEKTCTCGSTDGTHQEDCPLYVAPAEPDECTCDPKPAEGEAHQKGCPLYVEQTQTLEEVEIWYQVVGPDNCGTLDIESERLPLPDIGTGSGSAGESPSAASADLYPGGNSAAALGAEPTAAEGFRFVGWYKDEACTQPVDASWVSDNKLIPGKTKNYGTAEAPVMGYEAATYYARFENETASLTITMKSWSEETDENQSFLFDVTGPDGYCKRVVINGSSSVTIKGLIAGEYSIKEVTGWSWRYRPVGSPKKITLQPAQSETVSFSSNQNEQEWLSGDAYKKSTFGN